jgi:hypothetical protein
VSLLERICLFQILGGLRERYESHHKLTYTDEALEAAAKLAHQFISDRFLPDKAIDLIDEAGSRVRLRHAALPEEARELDKELKVRVWISPPRCSRRYPTVRSDWDVTMSIESSARMASPSHSPSPQIKSPLALPDIRRRVQEFQLCAGVLIRIVD